MLGRHRAFVRPPALLAHVLVEAPGHQRAGAGGRDEARVDERPLPRVGDGVGVVAAIAAFGTLAPDRKRASALVALGLLTSSALIVHFSHGVIEAHFHFFVVIVVLRSVRIVPQARAGVVERLGRYTRTLDWALAHRRFVLLVALVRPVERALKA